jgi:hypothetical protein
VLWVASLTLTQAAWYFLQASLKPAGSWATVDQSVSSNLAPCPASPLWTPLSIYPRSLSILTSNPECSAATSLATFSTAGPAHQLLPTRSGAFESLCLSILTMFLSPQASLATTHYSTSTRVAWHRLTLIASQRIQSHGLTFPASVCTHHTAITNPSTISETTTFLNPSLVTSAPTLSA